LPDDEPGKNHAEAADLAGAEQSHRHLGSRSGFSNWLVVSRRAPWLM
jgi:hypothetical protein